MHLKQCYSSVNNELSWPARCLTRIVSRHIREKKKKKKLRKSIEPNTHNTLGPIHFQLANTVFQLIHYNQAPYHSMRCNIKWEMLPFCSATFMSGVGIPSVNTSCLCILYLCFLRPHQHSLTHRNMVLNNNTLWLRVQCRLLWVVCILMTAEIRVF